VGNSIRSWAYLKCVQALAKLKDTEFTGIVAGDDVIAFISKDAKDRFTEAFWKVYN
jgi:arginine repressor